MQDLRGKTIVITGGASGIGLGMAEAFGREGMNVFIADIEDAARDRAIELLRAKQIKADGVKTDVTSRDSVRNAALAAISKFGKVHVVCNNAGIGAGGIIGQVPERDWDWVIDINLKGVVYGVEVFTPLMESHGEGGHFVNTASMAGHLSGPGMEAYSATKFAVVAMTEGWAQQLAPRNIGMSVLCPGFVSTNIHDWGRNRTAEYGPNERARDAAAAQAMKARLEAGMQPLDVGLRVVEGVKDNDLYIFSHVEYKEMVQARFERIRAAFEKSEASPALKNAKRTSDATGWQREGLAPR